MEASQTDNGQIPLILIHGAWLSARSWENYAGYLEFEGRPHLHMVAPDRQEVVAAIDSSLDGVLDEPEPATQQAIGGERR